MNSNSLVSMKNISKSFGSIEALKNANFEGANLENTIFTGRPVHQDTQIFKTNFRGANLSNAIFSGMDFSNKDLTGVNFENSDFSESNFKNSIFCR